MYLILSLIIILFIVFFFYFHRKPIRHALKSDTIVSPADGIVLDVSETQSSDGVNGTKISIFLSLFDVHTQYMPVDGEIISKKWISGSNHIANCKAAEYNNGLIHVIYSKYGLITVIQRTGALIRRLVSFVDVGKKYKQSDYLGMIRMGSRVEIILPLGLSIKVKPKDRVRGGETVIAEHK